MLNNLIRFVANTKAKASEVNYNFDQVKAKIQELDDWKTSTDDKLNKYSSFQLFDLIVTDRVLTGEEAKGKLLQGSLVTNLYPDAVAKIKDEWDNGAEQTYTYGGDISFPYRLAANRHMIVDILYKDDVDALFAATGVAWFYIWDNANEQFYLPRSLWFDQYTNDFGNMKDINEYKTGDIENKVRSTNKLLYFVVGNTYVNQEDIDIAQVESDLNNKLNIDHSNDPKPYIKTMMDNGNGNGYIIYSNGYAIQYGHYQVGSVASIEITFYKQFKNTNYIFNRSPIWIIGGVQVSSDNYAVGCNVKETTKVSLLTHVDDAAISIDWVATGYLAEGEY